MNTTLDNFRTAVIDGRPFTPLPLCIGRRVHCILYGGDNGTVVAINGQLSPQSVRVIGGGACVMGGNAYVDVAFDRGTLSRGVPEGIVYGVQWRILDEIVDAAGIAAALALCEETLAASKVEAAKQDAERAVRRESTAKRYAHLERVPAGGYSSAKLAAKNIRTELKRAFPGVKFSVTSDVFSGGDSVDVRWSLGPKTKDVEAISSKYQEGHFNGMEDIYENDRDNVFTPLFGGAKYVHETRETDGLWMLLCAQLCDLQGIAKPAEMRDCWRLPDDITRTANELIAAYAFPAGLAVADVTVDRMGGEEENPLIEGCSTFARFYRLAWNPAPEPQKPVSVAATAAGVVVSENAEKGGVEIRFPAKPAASVLESLKAAGWRWSRFSACWYAKASDAARSFASQLAST